MKEMIVENEEKWCEALNKDLRRCKPDAMSTEITFTLNEVNTAISDVSKWANDHKVSKTLLQLLDKAYIAKDPLGVVLIIAPWNYPVQLTLCPLIGAIAAGNCVIVKPSELAPNTSALIEELIPKYLDQGTVRVVAGGVPETTGLLKQRFDHILYTGAPSVAKIVMRAAAEFLTPVTLELGGKSPAIIDKDCDLNVVARRLAWGKFVNCGQTCVAPDYALCIGEDVKKALIPAIQNSITEFYAENAQESKDYGRIVNERHFGRLMKLLEETKAKLVIGGQNDRNDLFIGPTVLDEVETSDIIMKDEIFGPILPIVVVDSIQSAIDFINIREKPLALYLFTNNCSNVELTVRRTSSGAVTVNDCLMHMTLDTLPFGGVGNSGMGRYHGKFTFDTFTHEKAVLHRPLSGEKLLWYVFTIFIK